MITPVQTRRDELIERLATRLSALGLNAPAILFLQMHAPLSFLGSQLLLAAEPFLAGVAGDRLVREIADLIQEPENLERLIARLEE